MGGLVGDDLRQKNILDATGLIRQEDTLVVIGITKKDNTILMVERRKKEGNLAWAFPGGKVEAGETEVKAVEREIEEETNIYCKAIRKLGERKHPDTNRIISYWACEHASGEIKVTNPDEIRNAQWVDNQNLLSKITTDLFEPVREYIFEVV